MTEAGIDTRWLTVAGLLAVGLSVALVLVPGSFGAETALNWTGLSEGVLRVLAFCAIGVGCLLWALRGSGERTESADTAFPVVGEREDDPPETIGAAFDRRLERAADAATAGRAHDDPRDTLFSLAVDVVADTESCRREKALRAVQRGEWTDDPIAAAYLGDSRVSAPRSRRIVAWFRPRWTTVRRAERTVSAIEARLDDRGER